MAEVRDYGAMVDEADEAANAFERWALKTRRDVKPPGGPARAPGRNDLRFREFLEETFIPHSPLDYGLMAVAAPEKIALTLGTKVAIPAALRLGGAAFGTMFDTSAIPFFFGQGSGQAQAGPAKTVGKAVKTVVDALKPGSKAWREYSNPDAPFRQYAEEYPAVGPPQMVTFKDTGKVGPEKLLTPEAQEFEKAREKIMADMRKRGFEPYFDPEKRKLVDPSNYPARTTDTANVIPAKQETAQKYWDVVSTPEVTARLKAAIARGEELGGADRWYFMSQLEDAYTKELGPKAGRAAFLDEFAVPMAATTSGQRPGPNLMTAHYLEYLRKKGLELPTEAHQLPAPVGGRRAATNLRDYQLMRERGGYAGLGEDQPKMLDFSRSMIGDLSRPVMDEQMAGGMLAGTPENIIKSARNTAYGMLQQPVRSEAAARGVQPGSIQDVAWAGFKNEPGKPMIQIVNEAIERTHRLTGMARDEIVRRGLIRKEIPLYGLGGTTITPALFDRRVREE